MNNDRVHPMRIKSRLYQEMKAAKLNNAAIVLPRFNNSTLNQMRNAYFRYIELPRQIGEYRERKSDLDERVKDIRYN